MPDIENGGNSYEFPDENIVKTKKETDAKCPQCAGTVSYDPDTQMLLCPYCGYKQEIAITEEDGTVEEQDFESAENTGNQNWGAEKKTVSCEACGAQAIYDALEVSSVCPYCGSNHVMEAATVDTLAPNGVIAFMIGVKEAGARFTKWLKRKIFTPSAAKKSARPDAFKGFYLPYWTFDADTTTVYSARYGIDRTTRDSQGNTRTTTDWYPTTGVYSEFIDDCLVTGTDRHDENIMRRIEPFNTSECKPYKPEFVAGFVSERYSVGIKAAWEKAKEIINNRLRNSITDKIKREKRADHVSNLRMTTTFFNKTYKYVILPVWMSSFVYKSKVYHFMVNGQTGKVGGKAPVSALRVTIAVVIGLALLGLVLWVSAKT